MGGVPGGGRRGSPQAAPSRAADTENRGPRAEKRCGASAEAALASQRARLPAITRLRIVPTAVTRARYVRRGGRSLSEDGEATPRG
jgi:hypothetical protein